MHKNNKSQKGLIAYCGLYCSNCSKYMKGKCSGCYKNEKASWCKIRLCCIDKHISNCASCNEFEIVKDCKLYNNVPSRIIEFFTKTDRSLCINRINELGEEGFCLLMDDIGKMTLSKKNK